MKILYVGSIIIILLGLLSCNLSNSNISVKNHNVYLYNSTHIKNSDALKFFNLGLKSVEQDSLNQAKKYFYAANGIEPNNSVIINTLGSIQYKYGALDSAIYYYKLSLKIDSSNIATYIDYGQVLNLNKQYTETLEVFSIGLKKKAESSVEYALYLNVAALYQYLNDCEKVRKYSDTAILLSQNQPDAIRDEVNVYSNKLIELCH